MSDYKATFALMPAIFYGSSGVRSVNVDSGDSGKICPFHCHGDKTRYEHINNMDINTKVSGQLDDSHSSSVAIWFKSGSRIVRSIYTKVQAWTDGDTLGDDFSLELQYMSPLKTSWTTFYTKSFDTGSGTAIIKNGINIVTSGIRLKVTNDHSASQWIYIDDLAVYIRGYSSNRYSLGDYGDVRAVKTVDLSGDAYQWDGWFTFGGNIDLTECDYWAYSFTYNGNVPTSPGMEEPDDFDTNYIGAVNDSGNTYTDGCRFYPRYIYPSGDWTKWKDCDLIFKVGWGGNIVYDLESEKVHETTSHNDRIPYEYYNANITDYSSAKLIAEKLIDTYEDSQYFGTLVFDGTTGLKINGKISGTIAPLGITVAETFNIGGYKHVLEKDGRLETHIMLNTVESDVNKEFYKSLYNSKIDKYS